MIFWKADRKVGDTMSETRNGMSDALPEGLGVSLAMHMDAMKNFSNMSEREKTEFIEKSKQVKSKEEMTKLIDALGKSNKCM